MKNNNQRLVLLGTKYGEGIIFAAHDTTAIHDILTRATTVKIGSLDDSITPLDSPIEVSLILPQSITDPLPAETPEAITESTEVAPVPDTIP